MLIPLLLYAQKSRLKLTSWFLLSINLFDPFFTLVLLWSFLKD